MFVLLLAGFLFLQQANAQVTTNGGSGLATSYPSLASAITALNGVTMTSPVIITLNGNEVAPAGGYVITQAGGTSVNTIQIQGSGNTVTASPAQTLGSLTDAIFKLIGADWVTLKGFTMQENPANTDTTLASNKMTEWGVALLYGSLTNGSQHNTIQNNTISLNRVYRNSFGIYSNTRHSASDVLQVAEVTAASGANSFNHVYGNTISNVNFGVVMIGAGTTLAAIDDGNDIGGSSVSTANSILNWGGGAVRAAYVSMTGNNYGIFMNQQINSNVSYNSLNSAAVATNTVSLGGILQNFSVASPTSGTITITINNNSVSLSDVLTTGGMIGINDQGLATLATATININNNSVFDCFITGANAGAASFTGINNTSSPGVLNINGNLVKNINTVATSGSWTGIYQGGAVVTTCNMDNNQLGNASAGAVNFSAIASSQVVGILNSTSGNNCTMSISSNNFQGFNYATPSTGLFRCINQSDTMLACTINNNNFNNLTINTSASLAGFLIYASSMTPTITISGNYVTTQFSNVTTRAVPMPLPSTMPADPPPGFRQLPTTTCRTLPTGRPRALVPPFTGMSAVPPPAITTLPVPGIRLPILAMSGWVCPTRPPAIMVSWSATATRTTSPTTWCMMCRQRADRRSVFSAAPSAPMQPEWSISTTTPFIISPVIRILARPAVPLREVPRESRHRGDLPR